VVAAYAGSKRLRLLASLCLPYPAFSLAYDTHRNRLWVGDQAGRITGFDTINLQQATVFNTGFGRTWSLAWAGAEDVLMSGHQNGAIAVWDVQGRCRAHIDSGSWVRSIAVAPDGAAFLTSHNNGMSTIRRWSVSSLESLDEFTAYKSEIWSVQYLPDGLGFVSGGKDSIFTAQWFTAKGTPAYAIKKHKGSISSVAVHPGGEFAVTGSWTGTLKLWNVHKGEAINSLEAHAERITGANFSDDGNLLASADKDGNIAVWQMPQCALLLNQHGHEGWIRGIRFFNDKQLATISSDGTCKIWLLEQGLPVSADIKTESALREGSDGLGSADTADDE
jgi:WD40 repeat protein